MAPGKRLFLGMLPLLLLVSACTAQKNQIDRAPAVAGGFYPGKADELEGMLTDLFAHAVPAQKLKNVVAIIVPHAGYVYSGGVAASGYNQIDREKTYDNIFIIGPSHYVGFEGASVYTAGNFITPLGTVEVNRALGEALIRDHPCFSSRTDAHASEHSVEVQIPFLQHLFRSHLRIVPIVVGENSVRTCKEIAGALRPYLKGANLFVISSDFSHYPSYDDAVQADRETVRAILANSPDSLIAIMDRHERAHIPNLATSLCGWSAVLTLLYMTGSASEFRYTSVQSKNSGDSPSGNRRQVVGYNAIALTGSTERSESFHLGTDERKRLLAIARQTIEGYLGAKGIPEIDPATLPSSLNAPCGAFVTLNEHHELRGCVGRFDASEPLYRVVQQMAIASATQDYRFSPVSSGEVKELQIEISVLTPMRPIHSIDEFELGTQGIYMRKGNRAGTFLPQVAQETGWTKEEFLGHCARDKAGIGWDGWKDADLYVYEALVFGEGEG